MPESLDDTYITSNSNSTQLIGDITTNHSFQIKQDLTNFQAFDRTCHSYSLASEQRLASRDKKKPIEISRRRGRLFHKPSIGIHFVAKISGKQRKWSPKIKRSSVAGSETPSNVWLKLLPKVKDRRFGGKFTFCRLWLKWRPKVSDLIRWTAGNGDNPVAWHYGGHGMAWLSLIPGYIMLIKSWVSIPNWTIYHVVFLSCESSICSFPIFPTHSPWWLR